MFAVSDLQCWKLAAACLLMNPITHYYDIHLSFKRYILVMKERNSKVYTNIFLTFMNQVIDEGRVG